MTDSPEAFLRSLEPVVEALGATVIPEPSTRPGDIAVEWDGDVVAYVRKAELHGALERLVAAVEADIGVSLSDMSREQKQMAVRLLDEQGAFLLRGSVEDIAQLMDVSRVTLYTYLNTIRPESG